MIFEVEERLKTGVKQRDENSENDKKALFQSHVFDFFLRRNDYIFAEPEVCQNEDVQRDGSVA